MAQPTLKEMREAHPDEWQQVQAELSAVVATGDMDQLKAYVQRVSRGGGGNDIRRVCCYSAARSRS